MVLRALIPILLLLVAEPAFTQFERTHVNISCPCTLTSSDGEKAELAFGISNNRDDVVDELYATLAIAGTRLSSTSQMVDYTAFVDTVALNVNVEPHSAIDSQSFELDLGAIPEGTYYFEVLLHENEIVGGNPRLDSIWFEGEWSAPISTLSLRDANYLIDSDDDGIDDINERLEGTDPNDPNSYPPDPVIDILFLHEEFSFEHYNTSPNSFIAHVLAVTNDIYERSNSPVQFRAVGVQDSSEIPEISDGESLEESRYLELLEEYDADIVLVYRTRDTGLCGFAITIGALGDRGFLHPNERFPYTELFLDPSSCSIDTTAHEIGHLMGLGHSYEQLSTGAFVWSRGHAVHGEFGTVMSYAEIFFRAVGIDVFSDPELDCSGKPCGVPHTEPNSAGSANSALTLNIVKYQFARTSLPDPSFDFDGDGVGAVDDAFPIDPDEWADSDGDRIGDNRDAFPDNPLEWADTDGDGVGDNTDPDIDNDGVPNLSDPNPFDATLTQPRLISISSSEREDEFGLYSTRVNDLDGDGIADLAVSAPRASVASAIHAGKVYLFSLSDFIDPGETASSITGSKELNDLLNEPESWVIQGNREDARLGRQLVFVQHTGGVPELAILDRDSIYLVNTDPIQLQMFDQRDGKSDRQIDLVYCSEHVGCTHLHAGEQFEIKSISSISDLDEDGMFEIAIVGRETNNNGEFLLYLLNRQGVSHTSSNLEGGELSISSVFESNEGSFIVTVNGFDVPGEIRTHGDLTDAELTDLLLGVVEIRGAGRVYVLNAQQLQTLDEADEDGDRIVAIDDLVSSEKTLRISNPDDASFGLSVNSLADLNGDNRSDLLVWGRRSNHYVFTNAGLRLYDLRDLSPDGSIELPDEPENEFGTWRLNAIGLDQGPASSTVLRPHNDASDNLLVTPRRGSLITAELSDLDYLDDPTGADLDGTVNIPVRIRYPGIYQLRVPFGPKGRSPLTGVVSLGDLDEDDRTDFAFSMHSSDLRGRYSTMYVVFSSELEFLDQADGQSDHIVMLHNNASDIDGDGIPNIHDRDDDGDGLPDFFDTYPHLSQFQYDADGDWHANTIDVYPLDASEYSDIDFDGIGDRDDLDIDGDGILNEDDQYPRDTDNDGLPNNEDLDDDNDSVPDEDDAFPLDPNESLDSDGDGIGDNGDAFVLDPGEWLDTDQDGIGNNADPDDDNDGYLDEDDAFPLLADEWLDSDGDGVGDNSDQFPLDPFEWEDLDGDGYGDNFGSTTFFSYRLRSDWRTMSPGALENFKSEAFRLGDFDRDGTDDLEISNALPYETDKPLLLVSGADLPALDELDGSIDRTIDLKEIHQGPSSWRFVDSRGESDAARYSGATVGDLNRDGIQDIVIFDPLSYDLSGSITLVYGGEWPDLDNADGESDGQIDLHTCVQSEYCTRIKSAERQHGFGLNGSLISNFLSTNDVMLTIGTFTNESRRIRQPGVGSAFLLPYEAITASTSIDDGTVLLDTVADDSRSWSFYPEFDSIFAGTGASLVSRVPDLDRDGTDEFLVNASFGNPPRIYIVASSDLAAMDSSDFATDQQVNLSNSYRHPNSFRIDGYLFNPSSTLTSTLPDSTNGTTRTFLLPLIQENNQSRSLVVDLRQLDSHDRAEGPANGVITSFETDNSGAWEFPRITDLTVCGVDVGQSRVQALASSFFPSPGSPRTYRLELYLFDIRDPTMLDMLDTEHDGTIDLANILSRDIEGVWLVSFSELAIDRDGIRVNCIGDLDGDDLEDIVITLIERDGTNARTQVILLAYADLSRLDQLDGSQDRRVDTSALWPDE